MGWKNVKEHYGLDKFVVHVEDYCRLCVGVEHYPKLVVIGLDGVVIEGYGKSSLGSSPELRVFQANIDADPARLKELIKSEDKFSNSITVYTFSRNGNIVEKKCEKLGWPNVTHDGILMYENLFSTDRKQVVEWCREALEADIKYAREEVSKIEKKLNKTKGVLAGLERNLSNFEAKNT